MAAGDIMIKIELRPCLIAENEKGLFHKWIKELNGTTKGLVEDIRERSHKDALDSWLYLIELYYKNADKILPFSYIESIERKTKGVFGGYNG